MSSPTNPVEYNQQYEGGTIIEDVVIGTQDHGGADDQGTHAFGIHTGAEQAEEDFFGSGDQNNNNPQYDQHQNQAYGQPQGNDGYDDFFGGGGSQPQGGSVPQYAGSPGQNYGSGQGGYGGNMYDANYDPEEEERLERLRKSEQDRNVKLEEKARNEREKKQEKIAQAAKDLAKWHSERETNNEKKKGINKANTELENQAKNEEDFKNPWDKVVANIATKEGEYPGSKDVTRFRQSLLNKKLDAGKGLNPGLTDF